MASPAASEEATPTARVTPVPRDAESELMPADALPIPDVAMPAGMSFACLGVAFAVRVLLEDHGQPGPVADIFNERLNPLCSARVPHGVVSFVWTEPHPALPLPRQSAVHDFVLLVVSRLEMTLKELCLAYAIVEQLVINHRTCAQSHCLRPIFLIACAIATKVTHDVAHRMSTFYDQVCDVFTMTSIPLMKAMELQLLSMLHFDLPTGDIHQLCARPPPPTPVSPPPPHARTHARERAAPTAAPPAASPTTRPLDAQMQTPFT